jgi:glycosidase
METCWFASYLPDLNWRHPDVLVAGPADLAWWMTRFDLDGLRLDAVPMMPRAATRHIMHAVGSLMYRAPMDQLVVGEIYTGAGDDGRAQIRYYLGSELDGLDSAFDFPLMWSLRDNIAHGATSGFSAIEQEVAAGELAWLGSGATIAHMIGNHDTTRFVSEADDDAGGDPWSAPPPQPTAVAPYQAQRLALAFVMTLPGIPVIYYGDEVGLAGAGDPDSRRVMPAASTLAPAQSQLLTTVQQIGRARRCSPALRGSRTVALADADHDVALLQSTAGNHAIVVLSRAATDATLDVPGLPAGSYRDAMSTATLVSDGTHATVTAAARAVAIYLPENDPCL